MPKITLNLSRDGKQVDIGELYVDVVPRVGEIVALDEGSPAGDFIVEQVKHYHFWGAREESNVTVFIRKPNND